MKSYEIKEALRGEYRVDDGVIAVEYGPGVVKAKTPVEDKVLGILVSQGFATEAPKKPRKAATDEKEIAS